jgi:hypothetical protein
VFENYWTTFNKYDNHSRLNNEHDEGEGEGDIYDHPMSIENIQFDNE